MKRCIVGGAIILAVMGTATSAGAAEWTDTHFEKRWVLTARQDEVLVRFDRNLSAAEREAFERREFLQPIHAFDAGSGVAVYRLVLPARAKGLVQRLEESPIVRGASLAMVDQDGYTKHYLPRQLVIQLPKTMPDGKARALIAAAGSEVLFDYWTPGFYRISTPKDQDVFEAIRDWYRTGLVLFAEPAYIGFDHSDYVPNDPGFINAWHLRNTGQAGGTALADIQAVEAWDITRGDPNVILAIIDTGVALEIAELAGNLLPRGEEDWNFACNEEDLDPFCPADHRVPSPYGSAHGTGVAGVSSAVQDNNLLSSGVCPLCRFMPLTVKLGSGDNATRADAINYAASRRAGFSGLVINMSWHMSGGSMTSVQSAVANALASDCVVMAATGNNNEPTIPFPAAYPGVIAVGATTRCDTRVNPGVCGSYFGSNYGPEIDVVAPGIDIASVTPSGALWNFAGTSAACPVGVGVAGLALSAAPSAVNDLVEEWIKVGAEDLVGNPAEDTPGFDIYMGWGRVNAYRTVQLAKGYPMIEIARGAVAGGAASQGIAWGDYDGDGYVDLYVTHCSSGGKLYRNVSGAKFVDATTAPLDDAGCGQSAAWLDYDGDRDLDLYLARCGQANRLFRNDGAAGFVDATSGALGISGCGRAIAIADYDRDGDVDIYLVSCFSPNKLFRNDGASGFTDVTPSSLAGGACGSGAAWSDYDGDGDPDLYIANWGAANKLVRNDGGGVFTDVTSGGLAGTGNGTGAVWGDYDNDGDPDLYLASYNSGNKLLRNDGGAFTDVTTGPLVETGPCRGAAWADYDNDGDLDLYVVKESQANRLLRNDGGGTFSNAPNLGPFADAGPGMAGQWADFNRDGRADLYLSNYQSASRLFRNHAQSTRHWLEVNLEGKASNTLGIGARIRVKSGTLVQTREVDGGGGGLAQASITAEFGLGTGTAVDSLTVWWPSGNTQTLTAVAVDQVLTIIEPLDAHGGSSSVSSAEPVSSTSASGGGLAFTLPAAGRVTVDVYSASGRKVARLHEGTLAAGRHQVSWPGTGARVPAGVYFYAVELDGRRAASGKVVRLP